MTLTHPAVDRARRPHRYLRDPVPLHFPEDEPLEQRVPESKLHRLLVNLLFEALERELGDHALIACDQFLYWDPSDPKHNLAPDVAIRAGARNEIIRSWKTWELGAPHVAVEIASHNEGPVPEMLRRYARVGVAELVRFDPDDRDAPLRLWDFVDGDVVERDLSDPEALRCDALGLYWCVTDEPPLGPALGMARDKSGKDRLLTPAQAALAEADDERRAKQAALAEADDERRAKQAALARIEALEAELARRR